MTKEQAIERLKKMIQINNGVIKEARKNGDIFAMQLTADLDTDSIAIEKVLTMLEEKDKEIQFQEDINKTELNRHKKTEKSLKGQIIKQNKMIDLMTETINNHDIDEDICKQMGQKANCNEFEDTEKCKECIKQYFINKAKEIR